MQPILVTGGAGFIGAHTCKDLAAHGFLPIAFDNLSRGHRDAVQWARSFRVISLTKTTLIAHLSNIGRKRSSISRALLMSANQSTDRLPIIEKTSRGLLTCSM